MIMLSVDGCGGSRFVLVWINRELMAQDCMSHAVCDCMSLLGS